MYYYIGTVHMMCIVLDPKCAYFRVMIGSTNGGNFNSVCGSEEKFKRFHELLFGPVGTKLVDMYMQCWKKADLVLCLKEAAEHTRTTKSPLSITEVVSRVYLWCTNQYT